MHLHRHIPNVNITKQHKHRVYVKAHSHQRMRHLVVKLRYYFAVVLLNCILVPIILRYYMCNSRIKDAKVNFYEKTTNRPTGYRIPGTEK